MPFRLLVVFTLAVSSVFAGAGPSIERSGQSIGRGLAETIEAPFVILTGALTADANQTDAGGRLLLSGPGHVATGIVSLPLCAVAGRELDLSPYARGVNDALTYLDTHPWPGQAAIPVGTRVRADGRSLVWILPGHGEIRQTAQQSATFALACEVSKQTYFSQERAFGFVVRNGPDMTEDHIWPKDRFRVCTIIHEFYHQYAQTEREFFGWAPLYWAAYFGAYPFQGYKNHWAESADHHGAYMVQRALKAWGGGPPA